VGKAAFGKPRQQLLEHHRQAPSIQPGDERPCCKVTMQTGGHAAARSVSGRAFIPSPENAPAAGRRKALAMAEQGARPGLSRLQQPFSQPRAKE
jgi:hypothetical protein